MPAYRHIVIAIIAMLGLSPNRGLTEEGDSVQIAVVAPTSIVPADDTLDLPILQSGGDAIALAATAIPGTVELDFPGPTLDLATALKLTLTDHPEISALKHEVYAAQGRLVQGSIKPNPEFEAEISEFMGTSETRYFVGAVSGFGVSQLIERGRKRCARMAVAEQEGKVAEVEIERKRLDIMLEVSEAYYTALVAQERLALAWEREQLSQTIYDTVGLRVEGGKSARLELTRVGIELAATRLEREQAEASQRNAMTRLSSLWGGAPGEYGSVDGELGLPSERPALEDLLSVLPETPELRRFAAEEQLRRARRDLAQAEGVPDITWSGGLERFEETDSFGFKVGVSFPIPMRRTTHGRVVEAQAYVDQVQDLRAAQLLRSGQRLAELHGLLEAAYTRARAIEEDLLPAAMQTFELMQVGYRHGKFGLLDVLDAQRTLIDARNQYFDAVAEYQLIAVEIERLVALPEQDGILAPLGGVDPFPINNSNPTNTKSPREEQP